MRAAAALALSLAAFPGPGFACRQALAIGLDVSGSVDVAEYALQMGGLIAALDDPEVRALLLASPEAPVALAIFEWSGPRDQRLTEPWTEITGPAVLDGLLARLDASSRSQGSSLTAVGAALTFGRDLLAERIDCGRLTLDLSGDGISNSGVRPRDVPLAIAGPEVTVNGLVIGRSAGGIGPPIDPDIAQLSAWYTTEVIRGPGAFVETALGFENFAEAMRRKLIRELIGLFADRPAVTGWRRG